MKCTRSRLLAALLSATLISLALHAQTCLAQQGPAVTSVRTVLALTSLPTVVDAPLFFKLTKVQLPANKSTNYSGPVGFIYVLSGSMFVQTDVGRHSLREGDALLLDGGKFHSLTAAGEPFWGDANPTYLLRARRERPRGRTTEDHNELAPSHRDDPKPKDHAEYSRRGRASQQKRPTHVRFGSIASAIIKTSQCRMSGSPRKRT
jgi:hypothetical protein